MAVDAKHKLYLQWLAEWNLIKTLMEGERAVKAAGVSFIPKLSGQSAAEYKAYVNRGSLFNATEKTIKGLTGAVVRKAPVIKTPSQMTEVLKDISLARESIEEMIRKTTENVMSFGFYGLLVDMPTAPPGGIADPLYPYIASYPAVDILNWHTQHIGGEDKLMMITLAEVETKPIAGDPYTHKNQDIIRVLYLDDEGNYKQQIWEKVQRPQSAKVLWQMRTPEIQPVRQGVPLKEIPFVFFNATSAYPLPSKPPMLDLANLNIKHWQVSTDYYHGLHYCAMPTPWAAGFKTKSELYIGAQKAWVAEDPQAKCGFLEFTGTGLGTIEKALERLELQMAVSGARLLEEQKAGVEAAEAIRLRTSGDTATLSTIVAAVEEGIENALEFVRDWMGLSGEISVGLNRDFVSQKLGSEEMLALLQAVQAGRISMDTFLFNLQSGEILPPDRTIQEEKDLIGAEAPPPISTGGGTGEFGNGRVLPGEFGQGGKPAFGGGQQ